MASLTAVVRKLDKALEPAPVPARAFELVLWENVGYLVDDDVRRACFDALAAHVGLAPEAIAGAPKKAIIAAIASGGMRAAERADKLRSAAELALEMGIDALERAIRHDERAAKRMLKRFPGIGDPGADRILLLVGEARTLAPESNGLRVLCRLGLVAEQKSYSATYRGTLALLPQLKSDVAWRRRAHLLLREHGKRICRRSGPLCGACPLTKDCAFFRATER